MKMFMWFQRLKLTWPLFPGSEAAGLPNVVYCPVLFKKVVAPHEIFANCRFSLLLDDIFASLRFICSISEVK